MKFEPDVADLSLSIDECDVGIINWFNWDCGIDERING